MLGADRIWWCGLTCDPPFGVSAVRFNKTLVQCGWLTELTHCVCVCVCCVCVLCVCVCVVCVVCIHVHCIQLYITCAVAVVCLVISCTQTFAQLFTDGNISYERTQNVQSTTSIRTLKLVPHKQNTTKCQALQVHLVDVKLIYCSKHSALFDVKYAGFFWHQNILSRFPHEPETRFDEFPSQKFRISCKPKTSCTIGIALMLTELTIKCTEIWK
jgi:hypothetical protein